MRNQPLETEAIVIGYAMSRLNTQYLAIRQLPTWREAFEEAGSALSKPPATFKNLRDEFDPIHGNPRTGWANRELRASRQRVLDELAGVSNDALIELVDRIIKRDEPAVAEAIESLAVVTNVASNVAERLLTGRRAEEYFLAHCERIIQINSSRLLDLRQSALGYDFGVVGEPETSIEVKGLKQASGEILFTDREWSEAHHRRASYCVVVVGNLAKDPIARVIRDPCAMLNARCEYRTTITASWRSSVRVFR